MPIEIEQLIRSKRRTITLIVDRNGSLIVRAPLKVSQQTINEFVQRSMRWIEKKQVEARANPPVTRHYILGEIFYYLGKPYTLEIVNEQKEPLFLSDGCFKLATRAQPKAELLIFVKRESQNMP